MDENEKEFAALGVKTWLIKQLFSLGEFYNPLIVVNPVKFLFWQIKKLTPNLDDFSYNFTQCLLFEISIKKYAFALIEVLREGITLSSSPLLPPY